MKAATSSTNIQIEQAHLATRRDRLDTAHGRAVPTASDERPLDEIAALNHRVKLVLREEVVVIAVDLPWVRLRLRLVVRVGIGVRFGRAG